MTMGYFTCAIALGGKEGKPKRPSTVGQRGSGIGTASVRTRKPLEIGVPVALRVDRAADDLHAPVTGATP